MKGMNLEEKKVEGWKVVCREDSTDELIAVQVLRRQHYAPMKLRKKDILLDAGANIGTFALWAYDKVAEVIAYEPDSNNYFMMIQNLTINNLQNKNVRYVREAIVGTDDSFRTLYTNTKRSQAIHSLLEKRGRRQQMVPCANINRVIENEGITAIKLDVEGSEVEIIKAIKLENWKKIRSLAMEFHHNALNDADRKHYNRTMKILRKNFRLVRRSAKPQKHWTTMVYAEK
jgi:FkbM family methyltransferase